MIGSKASRAGRLGLAVCLVLFIAQIASASVMLDFRIERTDGVNAPVVWKRTLESDEIAINYDHDIDTTNWKLRWHGVGDSDPIVTSNFSITNTTNLTQTYSVTVLNAVVPPLPGSTMTGGSIGGTITDNNGNVATVTTAGPGTAIYTSIIDNVDFVKMINDPFSQDTS